MNDLESLQKVLTSKVAYKSCQLESIEKLKGDASGRKYYRVKLKQASQNPFDTFILVELAGGNGPASGGDRSLNEDQAFLNLHDFYCSNGVRVPKLYLDRSDYGQLFLEDVGQFSLSDFCRELSLEQRELLSSNGKS